MSDYQLDRLGWRLFERLSQALLKSEFGAQVENWSGYRDYGKDAYFEGDLEGRRTKLSGPVVFQAKFVHQANASGANYWPALNNACRAESDRIRKRVADGNWLSPTTYVLMTNCPLTPTERSDVRELLAAVDAKVIFTMGESDYADLLDLTPQLARTYPQILTHRNLLQILSEITNRSLASRSLLAVAEAEAIMPVFAPTQTYYQAISVLTKHDFVVLSGPPEMGKTAIARVLAISLIPDGWSVVDCAGPEDVFAAYSESDKQVFVADDAFGRTEYDVSRGAAWEAQFSKIYKLLDNRHWLIWTSRKHILQGAIREMDTQGSARRFPDPAEVIVKAESLTEEEKGLILFRHVAQQQLSASAKSILKTHLTGIVRNAHFTPERIRRLVGELLPSLDSEIVQPEAIKEAIRLTLENPTEGMSKSFAKLTFEHKWLLVCLLDEREIKKASALEEFFKKTCPNQSGREVRDLLGDLVDGFVKIVHIPKHINYHNEPRQVDWVHPSYRDLIISALRADRQMRLLYLNSGSDYAIALAVSREGGTKGTLMMPLLPDSESWKTLEAAVGKKISSENLVVVGNLLRTLAVSLREVHSSKDVADFAHSVCSAVRERWDSRTEAIIAEDLRSYYTLASLTEVYEPSPQLESAWLEQVGSIKHELSEREKFGFALPDDKVRQFCDMAAILLEAEPRFLRKRGMEEEVLPLVKKVLNACEEDADGDAEFDDAQTYEEEAERLESISSGVHALLGFQQYVKRNIENVADEMIRSSRRLRVKHESKREEDRQDDNEDFANVAERHVNESFNVSDLFREILA